MSKTYAEYYAELSDLVDASGDPSLNAIQLERILRDSRVADPAGNPPDNFRNWTPGTVIAPGSYIVPTGRDGYVYYTALGGTTGASEPGWGVSTVDNTVTWTRYAYAGWGGYYDMNRAAAKGWRLKASKAAKRKDVQAFGQTNNRTSTYEHCIEQAEHYEGRITDSISVASRATARSLF